MRENATLAEICRRWKVDPATARAAIKRAGINKAGVYVSPRYDWLEILQKIEKWPDDHIDRVNLNDTLHTTEELADRLGVTTQTVRNYGRSGVLHRIDISSRAVRYRYAPFLAKTENEAKTADPHKK